MIRRLGFLSPKWGKGKGEMPGDFWVETPVAHLKLNCAISESPFIDSRLVAVYEEF